MSIGQKVATAGTTLQNNLNARGVACTFGKNSDNKKTITDMANLITSDNLKGSNDVVLNIYANRPYLMDGETTDIIATWHDGLGNPLSNKEITITADIEDEVMDNIFSSSTWNNDIFNSQEGILNNSSSYAYMTKEFTGLNNYTLSFTLNGLDINSSAEFRFGDTTSGTASNYLRMKLENMVFTISKVVNNVETTVYTYTFGQQTFIQFMQSTQTITRSGDTFTFFGQTITLSGLKNTIGLVGTIGFYQDDFTVTSLYTGITNKKGIFEAPLVTVDKETTFNATYNSLNDTCDVCKCLFFDPGVSSDKNTDWFIRSSDTSELSVTVTPNGTTLRNSSTETSRYYFANPQHLTINTPTVSFSGDFVIECDILSHEITGSNEIAVLLQGLSPTYNISSLTCPFHVKNRKRMHKCKFIL